jgi:LuxR family maltose regulon positive regulatory protein
MEIPAKITRPSPAELYPRIRLFHRLDQSRRPVIFINGPPGSGKTSLITSYVSARKLPCLWYQIDITDEDVASFFYHMGIATTRVTRERRRSLPLLTPEYLMGVRTFTLRFFAGLYSRVLNKGRIQRKETGKGQSEKGRISPRAQFVIVFDNYQDIAEESPLQTVIRDGLSVVPEGIRVIVVSRSEPPPGFCRNAGEPSDGSYRVGRAET